MLVVDPRHQTAFAALDLSSFAAVVAHFKGDSFPAKTQVRIRPQTMTPPGHAPVEVYYKQYNYRPASWGFLARRSKARREFDNYATMEHLGIRCAERVACGELRDSVGRLQRAFIVTRAIPGALNLIDFVTKHDGSKKDATTPELRRHLRRQLAALTRASHDGGFFHNDLYWRNVLVTAQPAAPPAEAKVWWIDSPRGQTDRWSPWRRRRRVKDLAALDKAASTHCRRSERAAFVAEYLGKPRLDDEAREWIRETLAYRQQRWPEDWHGR